jgi:spore germination cell wall hydrolase CwlJ-like protein
MGWIFGTVAPWALAGGMLVSFTATAGQDLSSGISAAPLAPIVAPRLATLVPSSAALGEALMRGPAGGAGELFDIAALDHLSEPDPEAALEAPPRDELKARPPAFPEVDRTLKGDPPVPLRPSLSRLGRSERETRASMLSRMLLSRDERLLPPTLLMPGDLEIPSPDDMAAFEPWSDDDTMTERSFAPGSPPVAASVGTGVTLADGATPAVSRAESLASATPAPADATPMQIAGAPVSYTAVRIGEGVSAMEKNRERPQYADLIDPQRMSSEQRCLAEAIYFEARGESEAGQAAVAQVVLNRVRSGLYPSTVCGVVYQNRHRYKACQFSFACEGRALRITEAAAWRRAVRIAREVTEGTTYLADVGGATHYHANYVRPYWAKRLKKMDVIGRHVFYQLRPGQR